MPYQPHDLLRVDPAGLSADVKTPPWVQSSLREYPWVVVRRDVSQVQGRIPVGIRGVQRSYRFAMQLDESAVLQRLQPWALADGAYAALSSSPLPALAALPALAVLLKGWRWGLGGSVGFHLATGAPCIHSQSDLDILLFPRGTLSQESAAAILQAIQSLAVRTDVLIETPDGAYALAEYGSGHAKLLFRTPHGPMICQHPNFGCA